MEIGNVRLASIESEMRQSYLDYAMSVIVQRALPDAVDRGAERGFDALREVAPVGVLVAVGLHDTDFVQRLVEEELLSRHVARERIGAGPGRHGRRQL